MQDSYLALIKFILPTYILDHFELKSVKEQKGGNALEIQLGYCPVIIKAQAQIKNNVKNVEIGNINIGHSDSSMHGTAGEYYSLAKQFKNGDGMYNMAFY